jgi:hypothetical protein
VAVDISGRHAVNGRYYLVCAAVSARISPERIERVHEVRLVPRVVEVLDLNAVADLMSSAAMGLEGTVVAERGDLFNLELWRSASVLGRELKYPETIGEILAIELAHHISVAGRRLVVERETS